MSNPADLSHLTRLTALLRSARAAPPGAGRIATAVATGLVCHALFGLAVLAMIGAMFFGMSESFGRVPWPWAIVANTALLLQFPLVHSLLLGPGRRWLARLG